MAKKIKLTGIEMLESCHNGIMIAEEQRGIELAQIELEMFKSLGMPDEVALAAVCMNRLTDEQRKQVIQSYCTSCGSKDTKCQCWNDE